MRECGSYEGVRGGGGGEGGGGGGGAAAGVPRAAVGGTWVVAARSWERGAASATAGVGRSTSTAASRVSRESRFIFRVYTEASGFRPAEATAAAATGGGARARVTMETRPLGGG
jgi:hypothetical protein